MDINILTNREKKSHQRPASARITDLRSRALAVRNNSVLVLLYGVRFQLAPTFQDLPTASVQVLYVEYSYTGSLTNHTSIRRPETTSRLCFSDPHQPRFFLDPLVLQGGSLRGIFDSTA